MARRSRGNLEQPTGSPAMRYDDRAMSAAPDNIRQKISESLERVCPGWTAERREAVVRGAWARLSVTLAVGTTPAGAELWGSVFAATLAEVRDHAADRPAELALGAAVQACLTALDRPARLALTLHVQGHPASEIAGLLGRSIKQAEQQVVNALSELRACLEAKGMQP